MEVASADAGRGGIWIALAGIALLFAATGIAYRPPAPAQQATADRFSAGRARDNFVRLPGANQPHPTGSAANELLRAGIVARLTALGYSPELQSGFVCNDGGECATVTNVVARLEGFAPDAARTPAVLLAAHYDSVPAGPGASDDGVGAAAVLEIAAVLKHSPALRGPVILLIDDGEEGGLLGASLFVREHRWAKGIGAAVNLDARGTSGPALMFETGGANAWSIDLYARAVARPVTNSIFYLVYKLLPNDTDFTVFKAAGWQGFNFAFIGMVSRYHTPLDTWANADPASLQDMGEHALSCLQALAGADALNAPAGDAVYFDVFGRSLLRWPAALSLPAALGVFVLLLGECAIALRSRLTGLGQILWGLAAALLGVALGLALAVGLQCALSLLGRVPSGLGSAWIAYPVPLTTVFAAIAFLAVGSVSLFFAPRAGFWGLWFAVSLLGAALAAALAWLVPAACFVFLVPALGAALGFLPAVGRADARRAPWQCQLAALLPALLLFAMVLPMLWFLPDALGSLAWPIITLVLGFGAITLLPLLAAAARRQRQTLSVLALLIALAGALGGAALPAFSVDWPQAIDLEYWRDATLNTSQWRARTGRPLPAALAAAGHFDTAARSRFPGSLSRAFFAAAPALILAPPELDQLGASPVGSLISYRVRLRSPRGAPLTSVIFPPALQVDRVELLADPAAAAHNVRLERMHSGARALRILTMPPAGVEFTFLAPAAVELQVFDLSYGLPPAGQVLQSARPPTATAFQEGDLTVAYRRVRLAAP